jgi:N-carbamoyl-L-amino-acid hydrolase
MGEELKRIGYAGTDDFSDYKIHAAIEVHIEQGTILEDSHDLIGAVPGAMGQKWYEVTFTGMAAHAGTTPMTKRRDALLGLSEAVLAINQIGHDENPKGRATVGVTRLSPASRNVIPGEAWFSVEFRHPSEERLLVMDGKLQ